MSRLFQRRGARAQPPQPQAPPTSRRGGGDPGPCPGPDPAQELEAVQELESRIRNLARENLKKEKDEGREPQKEVAGDVPSWTRPTQTVR